MGCYASTDKKIELLFKKFQIISLANLNSNYSQNIPTLVCGRILPVNEVLISPVKEKQCIHYETKVSKYQQGQREGYWELQFTERYWRDFYLHDPQNPQIKLYISAQQHRIIRRAVNNVELTTGSGLISFGEEQSETPSILEFLKRNNYKLTYNYLLGSKSLMRYEEETYDVHEQIACLGFIQDGVDSMGQPIKLMIPIKTQSIPESYFQENHWKKEDINLLRELCGPPSIVSTNDKKLFRGLEITIPLVVQAPVRSQAPVRPRVIQYQQLIQYQQQPIHYRQQSIQYLPQQQYQIPQQQSLQYQQMPIPYQQQPQIQYQQYPQLFQYQQQPTPYLPQVQYQQMPIPYQQQPQYEQEYQQIQYQQQPQQSTPYLPQSHHESHQHQFPGYYPIEQQINEESFPTNSLEVDYSPSSSNV